MKSDDNVIQAFQKSELPEQTLVIEPRPPGLPFHCDHPGLRIDTHERTITCAACLQVLEPFDFLHRNALTLQRAWTDYRCVKQEISTMQDRVTTLKKEEKRLRAMVKRLQSKTEIVDVRGKSNL